MYSDPYLSPSRQGVGISTPAAPGTNQHHNTTTASPNSLTHEERAELQSVKSRLKSLVFELDEETAKRIQVDAALQHEREMVMSPKNARLLRSRDVEIAELKEEVGTMKNWLQKGVAEAHRIAAEITDVKAVLVEVQAEEADANAFNENVRAAERKLAAEVDRQIAIRDSLEGERQQWLESVSEANQLARSLAVETTKLTQSRDGLSSKQVNLKGGARRLEVIEVAMSCLGAALRRAEHTTKKVHTAVNTGNPAPLDPATDDGFDSEDDAPSSTFPPKVAIQGQEGARRMAASLEGTAERFRRFTMDALSREENLTRTHMSRVAAERAALETIRHQRDTTIDEDTIVTNELETERELLLMFLQERQEKNVVVVKGMSPKGGSGGKSGHDSPLPVDLDDTLSEGGNSNTSFSFMRLVDKSQGGGGDRPKWRSTVDQILEDIRLLKEGIERTKRNTIKWSEKVGSQDGDYDSVKKLRSAYRDVESKKTLLGIDIRDMENLNKELKLYILQFSDAYTSPPQ